LRNIFIIFSMLLFCSCDHFEQDKIEAEIQLKKDAEDVKGNVTNNMMRVANNMRDNIKRTNDKMRDWWITPLPISSKKPIPARYCYRVLQDILCYRQQRIGWEGKLVGYQGSNAVPPIPATMKLLPLRADDASTLPENRAASVKPVFDDIPEDEKKQKNSEKTMGVTIIDPLNEILPNSALLPQL
jgi:hypothetical protein